MCARARAYIYIYTYIYKYVYKDRDKIVPVYTVKTPEVAGTKQLSRDGRKRGDKWITPCECILYNLV